MKIYDNVDQLTPELIGTAITFKIVTEDAHNPNLTVEHVTARLVSYSVAEASYTKGIADGIVKGYQIVFDGYPTIKGSEYIPTPPEG